MHGERRKMQTLVKVPVRTLLTPLQEYVVEAALNYGIIAGGFAAYLYDAGKKPSDIDLFVNEHERTYDALYQKLSANIPLGWRVLSHGPRNSNYDDNITLRNIVITDYSRHSNAEVGKESIVLQCVYHQEKDKYATVEQVLNGFDFNVCKASLVDKETLLVDEHFLKDIKANRLTFRPYQPKKSNNSDYGYRINKYVEGKGYDITFGDLLTIFGMIEKKRQKEFFIQLTGYNPVLSNVKNKNIQNFANFVLLMKSKDPEWNTTAGDFF
jgi:hypothetical protein